MDGSSDNSGQVCDELSHRYSYSSASIFQNGGVSHVQKFRESKSSRGVRSGFRLSIGDDFVTEDYLETLLQPVGNR